MDIIRTLQMYDIRNRFALARFEIEREPAKQHTHTAVRCTRILFFIHLLLTVSVFIEHCVPITRSIPHTLCGQTFTNKWFLCR